MCAKFIIIAFEHVQLFFLSFMKGCTKREPASPQVLLHKFPSGNNFSLQAEKLERCIR